MANGAALTATKTGINSINLLSHNLQLKYNITVEQFQNNKFQTKVRHVAKESDWLKQQ